MNPVGKHEKVIAPVFVSEFGFADLLAMDQQQLAKCVAGRIVCIVKSSGNQRAAELIARLGAPSRSGG